MELINADVYIKQYEEGVQKQFEEIKETIEQRIKVMTSDEVMARKIVLDDYTSRLVEVLPPNEIREVKKWLNDYGYTLKGTAGSFSISITF